MWHTVVYLQGMWSKRWMVGLPTFICKEIISLRMLHFFISPRNFRAVWDMRLNIARNQTIVCSDPVGETLLDDKFWQFFSGWSQFFQVTLLNLNQFEVIHQHFCNFSQGFRVVPARHCWHKSLVPLMAEVRQQMGGGPVYLSFDIDALDPCYAPATG